MRAWLDPDAYGGDGSGRGLALENDAAVFWQRVFEVLLAEQAPYERVLFETGWDGPRFIVYAVEMNQDPGNDSGWRLQCNVPAAVRTSDRWILFLSGAGREPAVGTYRALKRAKPAVTFWRSEYGDSFGERLPL